MVSTQTQSPAQRRKWRPQKPVEQKVEPPPPPPAPTKDSPCLHWAAYRGNVEVVQYLLSLKDWRAKKRVNSRDGDGRTPLHFAAISGNVVLSDYLCEVGAALNAQDAKGNTPLHLAAYAGHADIVRHLLSRKANRKLRNDEGLTPRETTWDVQVLYPFKEIPEPTQAEMNAQWYERWLKTRGAWQQKRDQLASLLKSKKQGELEDKRKHAAKFLAAYRRRKTGMGQFVEGDEELDFEMDPAEAREAASIVEREIERLSAFDSRQSELEDIIIQLMYELEVATGIGLEHPTPAELDHQQLKAVVNEIEKVRDELIVHREKELARPKPRLGRPWGHILAQLHEADKELRDLEYQFIEAVDKYHTSVAKHVKEIEHAMGREHVLNRDNTSSQFNLGDSSNNNVDSNDSEVAKATEALAEEDSRVRSPYSFLKDAHECNEHYQPEYQPLRAAVFAAKAALDALRQALEAKREALLDEVATTIDDLLMAYAESKRDLLEEHLRALGKTVRTASRDEFIKVLLRSSLI